MFICLSGIIEDQTIFSISVELPSVKSIDCDDAKLSSYDKCLIIKYANGEVEYSGLVKVGGFDSILEGQLVVNSEVKPGSRVSVTLKEGTHALVSTQKEC